jgi:3-oxoacyl-[acyl-carrier-protein] synthase-3
MSLNAPDRRLESGLIPRMSPRSPLILGTGSYAPKHVLTNADLARTVETTDEWIRTRSGIRERRIAGAGETTSDMAVEAARRALADAHLAASSIDLLVVATMTPDMPMPAAACIIQHKLGLPTTAACFDVNAACTGFIYALDAACAMLGSGRYHRALVIGAEKLSSIVDWRDRTTCVLFGDGAGAVVLGPEPDPPARVRRGLLGTRLNTDGDSVDLLCIPHSRGVAGGPFIRMKGRAVFKAAVRGMEEAARDILEQQGLDANQIALVIPHQANLRIIEAIAQYLELPMDRFFVNLDRYGNTSAASIPIALDEARRAGLIKVGDLVLLVAFGAGLTYGSALVRW